MYSGAPSSVRRLPSETGMIPVLRESGSVPDPRKRSMRFVTTREATGLTGLSTEQLREWTSRRALIPADVQRRGRGSPSQYAWQTILLVRIAVALRDRFRVELQTHRPLFQTLRTAFANISFIALWGRSLAIYDADHWALLEPNESPIRDADAIIIRLDPHLAVISASFTLPTLSNPGQLELFPVRGVPDDIAGAVPIGVDAARTGVGLQRRRSQA